VSGHEVDGVRFEYEPVGTSGRIRLVCHFADETTLTDKFDVLSSAARDRFLEKLCHGRDALDREALEALLEEIANDVAGVLGEPDADDPDATDDASGGSDAKLLVSLGKQADLFHTPGGHDSEGFASLVVSGHRETWGINSRAFKRWLSKAYYDRILSVPSQEALSEALNVLAGIAIHDGGEEEVAVRIAERAGRIYLDLADDEWRVVEVVADGWRVIDSVASPVRFIRKRGMLPLPLPVRGGRIDELRRFVNVPGEAGWILYSACIVAYLRPRGPYPVLVLNGEHGSAKSTTARCARAVIDPNQAPLRRPPNGDRDLMIAATNSWFVAFDNISRLTDGMSDALCVIATGGGFSARQLYTDDEEKIFQAQRPVMLNGIEEVATRADLLDRSVLLALPVIPESERRPEDEFLREFEEARPRILGALLDAVACGLKRLADVQLGHYPRMADFAKWVVACSPAMGWSAESFLCAYGANREESDQLAVESSLIGAPLMTLVNEREWEGTATELVAALQALVDERTMKNKGWPDKGQKMRWALKRIAPSLRKLGYEVEFDIRSTDSSRSRILRVRKVAEGSSEASGSSGNGPGGRENADSAGRSSFSPDRGSSEDRPGKSGLGDPVEADSDAPDDLDDPTGTFGPADDGEWEEL
jgi:hypothetical protein